jgi:hypothetical protein
MPQSHYHEEAPPKAVWLCGTCDETDSKKFRLWLKKPRSTICRQCRGDSWAGDATGNTNYCPGPVEYHARD